MISFKKHEFIRQKKLFETNNSTTYTALKGGETVVLKYQNYNIESNDTERAIHYKQHHPNIVRFYGVIEQHPDAMVLEYMPEGDLYEFLGRNFNPGSAALQSQIRMNILLNVLDALIYIHDNNFIHGDIKCENIFLGRNALGRLMAKVGDFGLAMAVDPRTGLHVSRNKKVVGTFGYIGPEAFSTDNEFQCCVYTTKTDTYGFGTVMLLTASDDMSSKIYPHANNYNDTRRFNEKNAMPIIGDEVSEAVKELFLLCHEIDPSKRATARELRKRFADFL